MKIIFSLFVIFSMTFMNAQTKIIAHRGFWNSQPKTTENSTKALKNAQNLNIFGAEFDVHMTKDGKLIINHDEHHGKMKIAKTNYADLKKLKLSNGEKIPTLKKYLRQGKKDPSLQLIIELKPTHSKDRENEIGKNPEISRKIKSRKSMRLYFIQPKYLQRNQETKSQSQSSIFRRKPLTTTNKSGRNRRDRLSLQRFRKKSYVDF